MGDFSKYLSKNKHSEAKPVPNEYGGIYDKPKAPAQPKVGFIRARLNRDNFWNLIFWLALSSGFLAATSLKESFPKIAGVIFWTTIIGTPLVVRLFNKVTFTEDNRFCNRTGEDITDRQPSRGGCFVFSVAIAILSGAILDSSFPKDSKLAEVIGAFTILSGPSLYFMLINCPITIVFNLKALKYWAALNKYSDHQKENYYTSVRYYYAYIRHRP
jgi:hypothetical protein